MPTPRSLRPLLRCLPALLLLAVCRLAVAAGGVAGATDSAAPLPPEQVFLLDAARAADGGIDLVFSIRDGYYLYRERIHAASEPDGTTPSVLDLPPGKIKDDPNFGRVEIYRGEVSGRVRGGPAGAWTLAVRYQGCADAGLCYPPQTARFRVGADGVIPVDGSLASLTRGSADFQPRPAGALASGNAPAATASASSNGEDESERVARALFSDSFPLTLAAFFGAGLLLALTPCMLPMVPILSGIIVGQVGAGRATGDRWRAFALSLAYVLAMAVTYALVGVAAGLSGVLLSSLLQDPWVLSGFALIFVVLALSMFGVFDLQLPSGLQAWAGGLSHRVPGGHFSGAAAMGTLSALIVGPCIAPPLAGALLFISRSGDVWLGGSALFALALGMGVPLLAVGTSAGHLISRANAWYGRIRVAFGVILLGVAVWITQPVWTPGWDRIAGPGTAAGLPTFERVSSLQQVRATLANTGGRPVLLDFTAEWCSTCRELERYTFADAAVARRLEGWRRLRFDVTGSTPADREALTAFGLFGPPAVLLFDAQGVEQRAQRVLNFQPPAALLARLDTFKGYP